MVHLAILLYALIFIYINVFTAKRYYLCVCKEQLLTAMNRVFILTCIFLLLFSISLRADWQRPIMNYTRHTYKAGNQNWNIRQHDNGWIYSQ